MNELPAPTGTESLPTAAPAQADPPDAVGLVDPTRVMLHMPVDVRSVSLAVLAGLGILFAMHWASAVLIPLLLGICFSHALGPLVDRLERLRLPRAAGAALLIVAIVAGMGWTTYALSDDATELVESLPDVAQKVRRTLRTQRSDSESTIDKVQKAAAELEEAAKESGSAVTPAPRGVTRVRIERDRFDITEYIWSGTLGLMTSIGQAVVVLFITFFLLAGGSDFRRKLVKIAGPTFTQKKITVQALDEITDQIQRYLLMQVITSVAVGLATWLVFSLLGVEHAAVWGVVAFVLNFVPYVGALVVTGGSAVVAFVQFGSFDMALLVGASYAVIDSLSGYVLSPWLTSRTSRLNALTVFVGVLAFGWLWGIVGLLLGVPALVMIKAVCDRVDDLKPIGELLGT